MEILLCHPTPTITVVVGEGGSGGALALASADRVLAYAGSFFSVIGPEAAATILWRDPGRAAEAARLLRPTAADLIDLGIADALIPEPVEGSGLARLLAYHLDLLQAQDAAERIELRKKRWRGHGNR